MHNSSDTISKPEVYIENKKIKFLKIDLTWNSRAYAQLYLAFVRPQNDIGTFGLDLNPNQHKIHGILWKLPIKAYQDLFRLKPGSQPIILQAAIHGQTLVTRVDAILTIGLSIISHVLQKETFGLCQTGFNEKKKTI